MMLSIKELWKTWRFGDLCMIWAAIVAQSIGISTGLCQGYSAVMLPRLTLDRPDYTPEQTSWIASLGVISNPIGALIGGVLVDTYGRKMTLQSIVIPSLIGWITIAFSSTFTEMCIGRFVSGLTIGMSTAAYIYTAEITTPAVRGVLAAAGPALTSLGIFIVYVLGSFVHWKTVALICAGISMTSPVLLQWVPESPLWLASKGRVKEAYRAMDWLRQDSAVAQQEINEFFKEHNTETKDSISDKLDSICKWSVVRPFLILVIFFLFQELTGIYIILYYAVDFFKGVGTSMDAFDASMVVGGLRVIMGIVGACLINHIRRKVLATVSGIALSIPMIIAATSEYYDGGPTLKLICVLAHVCASMIGFLQLPWIMCGELYPQNVRGIMSGITTSCAYLLIFISIKTYPGLVDLIGNNGTLYMFGGCAILGAVFCIVFLPETKGKSLSEITKGFENNIAPIEVITVNNDTKDNNISIIIPKRKRSVPNIKDDITKRCKEQRKLSV